MQKSGTSHCQIGKASGLPFKEGQAYFEAMQAAGNYAFANRGALTQRLRDALRAHLGTDGDLEVIYDVSTTSQRSNNMSFMGPIAIAAYTEKVPLEH